MTEAATDRPEDQAGPSGPAELPAHRSLRAVLFFLVLTGLALAADLASKHLVFRRLLGAPELKQRVLDLRRRGRIDPAAPPERLLADERIRPLVQRQVFPGVRFTLSTNSGVVFGLQLPWPLVAIASAGAIALVVWLFAGCPARARAVHAALALILAGALGNLYDRLFSRVSIPGDGTIFRQVRDFLDCEQIGYPWVFNVADIFLVVGVAVLVLHWLRSLPRHHAAGQGP